MTNHDELINETIDPEILETAMSEETFFNHDDSVVFKMKQELRDTLRLMPYETRQKAKKLAEPINEGYELTKRVSRINGPAEITPKQYLYVMVKQGGWELWTLLGVSFYLTDELSHALYKYFISSNKKK